MERRRKLEAVYPEPVSNVFSALGRTLAFRRWGLLDLSRQRAMPAAGQRYRHLAGSVLRLGRVVAVTRPVGLTLKEVLQDPPCRVGLTLRYTIEPVAAGSRLRLDARYRLNHAAWLRGAHWDRRLLLHFRKQFEFIAVHLERMHDSAGAKRDAKHL